MAKSNDDLATWFGACGTWVIALCLVYGLLRAEKALYDVQQSANRMQAEIQKAQQSVRLGR